MVIMSLGWLCTLAVTSTEYYVFFQCVIATAMCMSFICGEAVVVERSKGQAVEDGNKMQTWIWGSSMVGGLLGGTIGGQ